MNANSQRPEPTELDCYDENRRNFPVEELAKYCGKHVAFSLDGTRILASGDSLEAVDQNLEAMGIAFNQVVHSYID
jgi:hypothetical protein